jgi:hypothetical protein
VNVVNDVREVGHDGNLHRAALQQGKSQGWIQAVASFRTNCKSMPASQTLEKV